MLCGLGQGGTWNLAQSLARATGGILTSWASTEEETTEWNSQLSLY